jgi:ribosome-associated protein
MQPGPLRRCRSQRTMKMGTQYREDAIEPEVIATALAKVALDKKGSDVAILDMRSLVDYTDVFLLITARNRRHVAALAEELRTHAKHQLGLRCEGIEGLTAARWVLVDLGSVVVHLFDEPLRGFYNLDGLWGDAPRLPVPESAGSDSEEPTTGEIEPPPQP